MNVFDLFAKLSLDKSDYDIGLSEGERQASTFGEKLKSGLGGAAKAIGIAVGAAATGVAALATSAVKNYANYEQLVGGVETLFKSSAGAVQQYAAEAYKTAGLSANEYMETVTGFSASLLQSLGGDTEKAAKYADTAIRDMSDNANKMGTSMELIQNAYQGFAKQNYTMLDNLKLGYAGTKSEMERLILDAEALDSSFTASRDVNGELAMSYADIVDAIHIVQTDMGILGTTAAEASSTIQGSLSALGSAWTNLVTGIADENADLSGLVGTFAESVATAAQNILPRISQVLQGIGEVIVQLAPVIADALPTLIADVLPSLISAAISLITALGQALLQNLPTLISTVLQGITQIITAIAEAAPTFVPAVVEVILQIVQTLIDNLPLLLDAVLQLVMGVVEGLIAAIPIIIEALPQIINSILTFLLESIPQLVDAGMQLFMGLIGALPEIITAIVAALPQIITSIVNFVISAIPQLIQAGITLFLALIGALPQIIQAIVNALPQIIDGIINGLLAALPQLAEAGVQLFVALIENLPTIIIEIVKSLPLLIEGIVKGILNLAYKLVEAGVNLVKGLWEGIKSAASWLWEKVSGWLSDLWGGIKNFFGIHSPSRVFRDQLGKNLMLGFAEGISKYGDYGIDAVSEWADAVNGAAEIDDIGATMTDSSVNGAGSRRYPQIVQNIYAEKMTPAQAFREAEERAEEARFLGFAFA